MTGAEIVVAIETISASIRAIKSNSSPSTQHFSWDEANQLASTTADAIREVAITMYGLPNVEKLGTRYSANLLSAINSKVSSGTTWIRATNEVVRDLSAIVNGSKSQVGYGKLTAPLWYAVVWLGQNVDKNRANDLEENVNYWVYELLNKSAVEVGLKPMVNINQNQNQSQSNGIFDSIWNFLFPKKEWLNQSYWDDKNKQQQTYQQTGFDLQSILPLIAIGFAIWYFTKGK